MSDLLRMDYINSLPQPFIAEYYDGSTYDVESIDVQTGLMRISVSGLLQVDEVISVTCFIDYEGSRHSPDSFFSDYAESSDKAIAAIEGDV